VALDANKSKKGDKMGDTFRNTTLLCSYDLLTLRSLTII
jgi:hypothetical protein